MILSEPNPERIHTWRLIDWMTQHRREASDVMARPERYIPNWPAGGLSIVYTDQDTGDLLTLHEVEDRHEQARSTRNREDRTA